VLSHQAHILLQEQRLKFSHNKLLHIEAVRLWPHQPLLLQALQPGRIQRREIGGPPPPVLRREGQRAAAALAAAVGGGCCRNASSAATSAGRQEELAPAGGEIVGKNCEGAMKPPS
jgi:hypothetical protein